MHEIYQSDLSIEIKKQQMKREKRMDAIEKWGHTIDMHEVLAPSIGARISMQ